MVAAAVAGAGIAGAVGSVASGAMASSGQKAAANTQAQAIQQEQAMAQPFVSMGQGAGNELMAELQSGAIGQPAPTTTADISQMPGYQFTLQQGLLSTQNAAAAQGLGVSGAALMGAANYATGLAQSNYQNYFSDYWANQMNRYNMLAGITGMGSSAAVGAGSNLGQSAAAQGQAQAGAAQASAAGIQGATSSLASIPASYAMTNYLLGQNSGSTVNPANTSSGYVDPFAGNTMPG